MRTGAGTRTGLWLLAGILLVSPSLAGCGSDAARAGSAPETLPLVECLTVPGSSGSASVEIAGHLAPTRAATVSSRVAGEVKELAEEGSTVAAGAAIAVIATREIPAQVDSARSGFSAAQSRSEGAALLVRQTEQDRQLAIATLEQTLRAAEAERDRRRAMLAQAELQSEVEPSRLRAQLKASEAKVRFLRSGERVQRIRQLETELEVSQAETSRAESQLRREQSLYGQGYVARTDVEVASLALKRARAKETQDREELRLAREGAHPEQILEAEHDAEALRESIRGAAALGQQVEERRAELKSAEAEAERAKRILQNARESLLPLSRARQEARAAASEADRSRVELRAAQERLRQTIVRAPFGGQVVRRLARAGESVAAAGAIVELVDPSGVQFEAGVTENLLPELRAGKPLTLKVAALGERRLRGRIAEVTLAADPLRQGYKLRAAIDRDPHVRAGMLATAVLQLSHDTARPRIPLAALQKYYPRSRRGEVFVVAGDRLQARSLSLEDEAGATVAVRRGLAPGERVVVSEGHGLAAGTKVRVREAAP